MLPNPVVDITPAFIVSALFIDHTNLQQITNQFLDHKQRSFLKHAGLRWHDCMRTEIKGSALRRDIRAGDKATRRMATNFIKNILIMLEECNAKLVARVYIKGIGVPFNGKAVYTSAIQWICDQFQHYLRQTESMGIIIADAREKTQNSLVSHSIFTRKFKKIDDVYPNIAEMPIFGHAENHAGLQIADIICSALLFPFAMHSYCTGYVYNCHVCEEYKSLKKWFSQRVINLQYTYLSGDEKVGGGIVVSDPLGHRPSSHIFR